MLCALARVNSPVRVFQLNGKFAHAAQTFNYNSTEHSYYSLFSPPSVSRRAHDVPRPSRDALQRLATRKPEGQYTRLSSLSAASHCFHQARHWLASESLFTRWIELAFQPSLQDAPFKAPLRTHLDAR